MEIYHIKISVLANAIARKELSFKFLDNKYSASGKGIKLIILDRHYFIVNYNGNNSTLFSSKYDNYVEECLSATVYILSVRAFSSSVPIMKAWAT